MVEEQQEQKEEATVKDMISRASEVADRLERANKLTDENIKRLEQLESRRILGGIASVAEAKIPPETPQQYAARMLRGGK